MSLSPAILTEEPTPLSLSPRTDSAAKRRRWFELALILFLGFSGSMVRAISAFLYEPTSMNNMGNARWLAGMFQEIGILLLLAYILWRSGRAFRDIGFRWSFKDAAVGLLLFVISYFSYFCGTLFLYLLHLLIYGNYPTHIGARQVFGHTPPLALVYSLINPFFEELVVRAYLMTEIRELTGSMMLAAAVSLVFQTSYHIYYGWMGMLSVGFSFLALVGYFAIWKRALPLVVAHGIFDVIGYIRLR
jgi:membrane protease YdiL (CAAX protease family)